jgi:uncharacterized membrane protein YraQ (UPF0718 family)
VQRLPGWLTYTVLRLLFVAVPLAVLLLVLPIDYWIFSVIAAVLIGLCLSYLFLRKQREKLAGELSAVRRRERREARPTIDDEVEDAIVDARESHPNGDPK